MRDGTELAKACRVYFDLCDANHPPQTREQFDIITYQIQLARVTLREELNRYDNSSS